MSNKYFTRSKARKLTETQELEETNVPEESPSDQKSTSSSSAPKRRIKPEPIAVPPRPKRTKPDTATLLDDEETELLNDLAVPLQKLFPMLNLKDVKASIIPAYSRSLKGIHAPVPVDSLEDESEDSQSSDDSDDSDEDDLQEPMVVLLSDRTQARPDELEAHLKEVLVEEVGAGEKYQNLSEALTKTIDSIKNYKTITLEDILESTMSLEDKYDALTVYKAWKCDYPMSLDLDIKMNTLLKNYVSPNASSESPEVLKEVKRLKAFESKDSTLQKILKLQTSDENKAAILAFHGQPTGHGDQKRLYVDKLNWYTTLPYQKCISSKPENIGQFCADVYKKLDADLYGMKDVKQQIISHVHAKLINPSHQVVLGLVGKPGAGKTECAKSLARALGLPFEQISMAGMNDPALFKGHDGVYSGSGPSILLQKLRHAGSADGVLLLDELDKLPLEDTRASQVQYSLLHLMDPLHHHQYQDLYLSEITHDLSHLWLIATMNDDTKLDTALKDRMTIIHVPDYSQEETCIIMRDYTFPKLLSKYRLTVDQCRLSDEACLYLAQQPAHTDFTNRSYTRLLDSLVRHLMLLQTIGVAVESQPIVGLTISDFKQFPYTITSKTIQEWIHVHKSPLTGASWEAMYL